MRDVSTEELGNENEDEAKDEALSEESESGVHETPHQGTGIGVTTRPTPVGLIQGLSAGGGGIMTKKFAIDDEEMLVKEEKQFALEVRHYDMLLKRAQVESMKNEIYKLSLKKTNLNSFSPPSWSGLVGSGCCGTVGWFRLRWAHRSGC